MQIEGGRASLLRLRCRWRVVSSQYGMPHREFLKKNLNASRPSEHPSVREGEISKRLGGIIGCKDKTSSWHLIEFPDGSNIGSTVSCRGETHRYTVYLH